VRRLGRAGASNPARKTRLSVRDLPVRAYIRYDTLAEGSLNMGRKLDSLADRALEKQRLREEDQRRLEQREVSREDLRAENSFFDLSLPLRIVDFGRPLRRPR
jgi:hypothetical protein